MQAAPFIKNKLSRQVLPIFKLSPLCLCLLLSACQKQDEVTSPTSSTAKIELIAQDLVPVSYTHLTLPTSELV